MTDFWMIIVLILSTATVALVLFFIYNVACLFKFWGKLDSLIVNLWSRKE
jgi:hypothetical protein